LFGQSENALAGPQPLQKEEFSDDWAFAKTLAGKNVMVTGCTGTIGQEVTTALLQFSGCNKVALFCRDDSMFKKPIADLIKKPLTDP
jgi:FlaA1/EpsC-like NDP-sugar epimerase